MLLLLEPADDDLRAVHRRIVFWLTDDWDLEVGALRHVPEIQRDADPFRIAGTRRSDRGRVSKAGCCDIEAHTEHTELPVACIARPASRDSTSEMLQAHAPPVIVDPDLS